MAITILNISEIRAKAQRNRCRLSASLATAAFLCGIAAAHARDCNPADKILPIAKEFGGDGGDPFDDKDLALSGEITKIEIWADKYVDAIKVTYGDSGFGAVHGGGGGNPGGNYSVLTLRPGEYITEISGQAADLVDRLCFSVNGGTRSCYGGGGGDYFQISADGRPLRSINGRSAKYVDRVGVSFGNWAAIDVASIRYDNKALDSELALAPTQMFSQTLINTSGSTPTVIYSQQNQLTHSETISWNNETSESDTHTVGAKFTFGKKDTAQAEFSYQYAHNDTVKISNGRSTVDTSTVTTGWSVSVAVASGQSVRATTTWKNVTLDLPFTYDLVYSDDHGNEVCRQKQTGALRGVSSFGIAHRFEPLTQ
jgi:Jacalin-like lectin domain